MAARELKDYLENGNIQNSVNLPTLVQPWSNVPPVHHPPQRPGAIASITGVLSRTGKCGWHDEQVQEDYAYKRWTWTAASAVRIDTIRALDVVLRVRLLNH
ncbi:MAG: hypothetical protein ACLT5P_09410 [Flavonifractor plautii]